MKVIIPMRQALADAAVLGNKFSGASWLPWRVLLIAAAGEKLTPAERRVFKRLTGKPREAGKLASMLLVVAGRRSGKTRAMSVFTTWLATCCDWSDCLSLGEKGAALFVSPVEDQAVIAHDYVAALVDAVPMFAAQVVSRTASTIELASRIVLKTAAANWRHNRGSTCIAVCLDESAFFRGADSSNSDDEILQALQPSLATTGGPMLLTSSPNIQEGILWKLFERHQGEKGDPTAIVVKAASRDLNPSLPASVIDKAFESDATAAAAEFGGEFRSPISNYLDRATIMAAVQVGLSRKGPWPSLKYVAHADASSGTGKDSFAAAIGHVVKDPGGRPVTVFDALFEMRPPFNSDEAVSQCVQLLRLYNINTISADNYGAGLAITAFANFGITLQPCPLSSSELYMHSLAAWSAGRVKMLDHQRAIDQIVALRRKPTQTGREVVDHPKAGHDDLSVCIAGVIWRCTPIERQAAMTGLRLIGAFVGPRTGFPGSVTSGDAAINDAAYAYASGKR